MKTWGTTENTPALIARVEDPAFNPQTLGQCSAAMQALAEIGDEKGVWPVAKHLSNAFQRGNAESAIKKFGPLAEKEALTHLKDTDPTDRQRAWMVLGAVATKASVAELEPLAKKETDRNTQIAATNALRLIQARP
jgi:HEAT repeat protein